VGFAGEQQVLEVDDHSPHRGDTVIRPLRRGDSSTSRRSWMKITEVARSQCEPSLRRPHAGKKRAAQGVSRLGVRACGSSRADEAAPRSAPLTR
jgi:hypothetical protein